MVLLSGLDNIVASISTTVSSDVAITKMMLCSNHISRNCKAAWTLVSNHHHVNIVSKNCPKQQKLSDDMVVGAGRHFGFVSLFLFQAVVFSFPFVVTFKD